MKKDIAVMISGGIDSYVAYRYAQHLYKDAFIYPMFINLKQPYVGKELRAAKSLVGEDLIVINAPLCTEELDNVPTVENQEIFGRNLLIAFYGANLGEEIWLAALETEMNPLAVRDKHPEFFHLTSALLTYVFKSKRFETVVKTPFGQLTKTEVIALGKSLGITDEEFLSTTSCYSEKHISCGVCSTCFKRWIAFVNNGVECEGHFEAHPYKSNLYAKDVVRAMVREVVEGKYSGRFTLKRYNETREALIKSMGLTMPERIEK